MDKTLRVPSFMATIKTTQCCRRLVVLASGVGYKGLEWRHFTPLPTYTIKSQKTWQLHAHSLFKTLPSMTVPMILTWSSETRYTTVLLSLKSIRKSPIVHKTIPPKPLQSRKIATDRFGHCSGGEEVLLEVAGTDATEAYDEVGHSEDADEILEQLYLGEIVAQVSVIPSKPDSSSTRLRPLTTLQATQKVKGLGKKELHTQWSSNFLIIGGLVAFIACGLGYLRLRIE
jgi:hypothetical protein